jgi:hypothetical protein
VDDPDLLLGLDMAMCEGDGIEIRVRLRFGGSWENDPDIWTSSYFWQFREGGGCYIRGLMKPRRDRRGRFGVKSPAKYRWNLNGYYRRDDDLDI